LLGGRRIHTPWAVAGGVREAFDAARRDRLFAWIPEVKGTAQLALSTVKEALDRHEHEIPSFGNFRSLHVGLVARDGALEYYGGLLRVRDGDGNTVADKIDPRHYGDYFGEQTETWSYLKFPYYKPLGPKEGLYRVGPLARLNACDYIDTPLAEAERQAFKALGGEAGVVNNSFYYHYARLIEILFAIEKIEELLGHPALLGTHVRAKAMINRFEGVGACEAPRGVLFHHYTVNDDGVLQAVNMLIATAQNNLAMNRTVRQLAIRHLDGAVISEGLLNRVEAGIRCFDPCLSCSTHALGHMAMHVRLVGPSGELLDERWR
jgi:NAD-reducing hydrogenase large subunit